MQQLWAPWRLEYIVGNKAEGCIFCVFPKEENDEKNRILYRGKYAFVIMNAFPYSNGHLLIPPYRHIADLTELTDEESLEIMQLAQLSCKAISAVCKPDAYNIGINLGTAAGAGIADHLHLHIVPRWNGDTNFMPVFADIKVIPEALETTYKKLKIEFDQLAG
ncbi:HIT domain-containing protein [bacterium]|nr:HIT domain-containing protein [bacterium]